jgi:hypothetical protein
MTEGSDQSTPGAGWYPDPVIPGLLRFWDGNQWTEHTMTPGLTRRWVITSGASLWTDKALVLPTGLAASVALTLCLIDLTTQRPVSGLGLLLVPAILLLVVGQVWAVLLQTARTPKSQGSWRTRMQRSGSGSGTLLGQMFGGLPKRARTGITVAFIAGILLAATAFPSISNGSPAPSTPTCPWPLTNHGVITCVSYTTYLQAGAGLQRFTAGILMAFFVTHFGVVLSEVLRRQRGSEGPTGWSQVQ